MPAAKPWFFMLSLCLVVLPLHPQPRGVLSASGSGSGVSSGEAIDAAKIAAVNALVSSTLKRDVVYRDLFLSEAFKNDWFSETHSKQVSGKRWEAQTVVSVDEGVADALYYGRYSTTVGALLDDAENAVSEAEPLLADAGRLESNGDLGGSETAYRRAAGKLDEAQRLIGPVEDAVFFSSIRKRKSPELKALIAALRASADEGLGRLKESRGRLASDAANRNVLDLLQSVEEELNDLEAAADEFYPIASAPRSYETQLLSAARDRSETATDALEKRRELVQDQSKGLSVEMEYPRIRVDFVLDRIDTLSRRFRSTTKAVKGELFRRSPPVRAAAWTFGHSPRDMIAVGLQFPNGIQPGSEAVERVSLPARANLRLEGAFPIGSGGFWCRTSAVYETERLYGDIDSTVVTQEASAGFYGDKLVGVGIRWDWSRRIDGTAGDPLTALSLTLGSPGDSLGSKRSVPLWLTTISWEIHPFQDLSLAREANLGVSSVLRPSPWLRLEAGVSSRARVLPGADDSYLASAEAGFGFRIPPLRPFLWRLSWEGRYRAPFVDDEVEWDAGETVGAFRFGIEYSF